MSNIDVIRAWKDEDYRSTLSQAELDFLPANPAGPTELSDEALRSVDGGTLLTTVICVTIISWTLDCFNS
jgi:mersacidin/lichenicidin family type 2 lantibiotic